MTYYLLQLIRCSTQLRVMLASLRFAVFAALSLSSPLVVAIELNGSFLQGGLLYGKSVVGQQVYYEGSALPLDPDGRFIVALDRDAAPEIVLKTRLNGEQAEHRFAIAQRKYDVQRIEGVARKYVAPNQAQVERARREAALVVKARRIQRAQNDFFNGFIWPVKGPISGVFGSQRVYNGVPKRPHYGVDIARPTGTPVKAPAAGLITMAAKDLYYSGGTLIIDHGHGLSSTMLHLSTLHVAEGDKVKQGQVIAEVGASGRVTGPHLDWRMNWVLGDHSVRLDPQLLVPEMPETWQDE